MKLNRSILLALFFTTTLNACSFGFDSARIDLPQNRFETPEVNGAGEFRYGIAMRVNDPLVIQFNSNARTAGDFESHRLDAAPVFSDTSETAGWDAMAVSLFAQYGIADAVDASIEAENSHLGWVKLKWQLLGKPRLRARAGDVSLALVAKAGHITVTDDEDCDRASGCGSYTGRHLAVDNVIADLALLAGYRVADDALFYAGGFYQHVTHDAANTISQVSENSVTSSQRFDWKGETVARGQILGLSLSPNKGAEYGLEGVWSEAQSEAKRLGSQYYGFRLSYAW